MSPLSPNRFGSIIRLLLGGMSALSSPGKRPREGSVEGHPIGEGPRGRRRHPPSPGWSAFGVLAEHNFSGKPPSRSISYLLPVKQFECNSPPILSDRQAPSPKKKQRLIWCSVFPLFFLRHLPIFAEFRMKRQESVGFSRRCSIQSVVMSDAHRATDQRHSQEFGIFQN